METTGEMMARATLRWALVLVLVHACNGVQPSARAAWLRAGSHVSRVPTISMARKPFKGGRLDDFVAAGEAEAKYGARRYAAVAEDAWKLSVEQREMEENRAISAEVRPDFVGAKRVAVRAAPSLPRC